MKNNQIIAIVLLVFTVSLVSCNGQNSESGTYVTVEASEFKEKVSDGDVQLVDVRTMNEYQGGHLKGAVLADYTGGQFSGYKSELDKGKPVYVYCAVGGRSKRAALELEEEGFEVIELKGGITNWLAQGYEVEK